MNNTLKISAIAIATVIAGAALTHKATASSSDECGVAQADWQPMETLQAELTAKGWKVIEMEIDDGCYEAEAIDEKGQKIEAYFNPATFEMIESEIEEADAEKD